MFKNNIKFIFYVVSLFFAFTLNVNAQSINSLFHNADDPVVGKKNAPVTVVEFFDYRCSHCRNMADIIATISQSNPNVRFVFKEFPIFGPVSEFAARAALAANKQGKYFKFSHALLTSNALSENSILDIAKSVGLNVDKLRKDMNSNAITDQLDANAALAQAVGARGTPAFFIGPTNAKDISSLDFVLGEMSQSDLESSINKAMKS